MFGSGILELAIGLIFFYFLLSTVCATINELISRTLDWRAKTLKLGIHKMLGSAGLDLMKEIYGHVLITGQAQGSSGPSYVSAATFSAALFDTLAQKALAAAPKLVAPADPAAPAVAPVAASAPVAAPAPHILSTADLRRVIGVAVPDEKTRQALLAVVANAGDDVQAARAYLERWFDDSMDRVSGWYKRRSQLTVLVLAVVLTTVVNGDTLILANSLWRDTVLRASVSAAAQGLVHPAPAQVPSGGAALPAAQPPAWSAAEIQKKVEELNAPLGWAREDTARLRRADGGYRTGDAARYLGAKLLGLLLTALAVSLGAPFWFDLLNRVSNLRSVGARPERADAA